MSKILKVVGASWLQTKISSYILGILGVLAILALFIGQMERAEDDGNYAATVFHSEKTGYRIEYWGQSNKLDDIPRGVARAYFRGDMDTTGWSLLEVETDSSYPDEIQAYAAGIVEGALSWYHIHTHMENTIRAKCEDHKVKKLCDKLKDTLDKSFNNWKTVASERDDDPFWHHVFLHYTQINGIFTGWKHGIERNQKEFETDISDLYWLNSVAEVAELQHKLNISLDDTLDNLPSLSSALLRIVNETLDDGSSVKKLYVAQNAAGSYSSMTRILKRYKFNYHLSAEDPTPAPGVSVDFSGYPGSITSQDEFYILKGQQHRMAVTGTAMRNYNKQLWKDVNIDDEVPVGPRITAANRLSSNVSSWAHVYATQNSGTACKQWLVVDFNKFRLLHDPVPKESSGNARNGVVTEISVNNNVRHTVMHRASGHTSGLLLLIEQVPGLTHARDLTSAFLEQGYMATYGLPLIKDIADATHVSKMEELHGRVFSVSESPRSVMFKRGYKNATSLESIIRLMRQNNMTAINKASQTEPCEDEVECVIKDEGYWSVLGTRGDIVNHHKEPYGVIDTKVVSGTTNNNNLEFVAISGPPYTEVAPNTSDPPVNRGNLITTYTDKFDDQPTINGLEIRNLVQQQQEKAKQDALEILNRDVVKPFQWSESPFKENIHECLPDKWAFGPFRPKWFW